MSDPFFESINLIYHNKWFWLLIAMIVGWIIFGGVIVGLVNMVIAPAPPAHHLPPAIKPIVINVTITPTPTPAPTPTPTPLTLDDYAGGIVNSSKIQFPGWSGAWSTKIYPYRLIAYTNNPYYIYNVSDPVLTSGRGENEYFKVIPIC